MRTWLSSWNRAIHTYIYTKGMSAHAVAVGDPGAAERTSTPGAMMSMQPPPLLKLAMSSPSWMAPTAITDGPLAGLSSHASASGQDAISPSCIERFWDPNHTQAFLGGRDVPFIPCSAWG